MFLGLLIFKKKGLLIFKKHRANIVHFRKLCLIQLLYLDITRTPTENPITINRSFIDKNKKKEPFQPIFLTILNDTVQLNL